MNHRTLVFFTLPFCAAALLHAQINPPKAGVVRFPDGTVHAVYGLPANYIVDGQVLASADAVSFSDLGGMIAKDGRISLVDAAFKTVAEYDSGEAAPLLNINGDLKSAVAWLPTKRALLHWNGTSFVVTEVNGSGILGAVSSVRIAAPNIAKLLATNSDKSVSEAAISLLSGELTSLDTLPGVRGPAFHQQSFVVFPEDQGLAIAGASAVLRTLPLPLTDLTFERMSSDSLHILSPSTKQNWILHLGAVTPPHLSQLPESPARLAIPAPEARQ